MTLPCHSSLEENWLQLFVSQDLDSTEQLEKLRLHCCRVAIRYSHVLKSRGKVKIP